MYSELKLVFTFTVRPFQLRYCSSPENEHNCQAISSSSVNLEWITQKAHILLKFS